MPRLTAIRKQALDGMMKEALFEAAVAVLSEHGVEGMTMDRVALAAGVAKGSVYNYFHSKQDLVEFVYRKTIDPLFDALAETLAAKQSAIEKLAAHLHKVLDHVAKHGKVFRLLFEDGTAQGLLQSSQRSTLAAGAQRLAEVFRQGIAEGVFRPADPLLLANMYHGLCKGVFETMPELEGAEQRDNLHRLIMGTFLNGIATERGRTV